MNCKLPFIVCESFHLQFLWQSCAAMMSWVGCLLTDSGLPDTWKLVRRMRITEILRRIWLFSANKIWMVVINKINSLLNSTHHCSTRLSQKSIFRCVQKSLCQTNELTLKSGAPLENAFEALRLAKAPGAICPPSPGNNPRFYKVEPTEIDFKSITNWLPIHILD